MQRAILLILVLWAGGLHAAACEAKAPACAYDARVLQATTSTPARITGSAGESVDMFDSYPHAGIRQFVSDQPMHLAGGAPVEVIASCGRYAYVRSAAGGQVSSGWVAKARLQVTGPAHPRPADSPAQICSAAARIVNRQGSPLALPPLPYRLMTSGSRPTPAMVAQWAQREQNDVGSMDHELAKIRLHGRTRRIVSMDSGGTCSSSWVQMWSGPGRTALASTAPHATDVRWWGDTQAPVQILGHPLIERYFGGNLTTFSLNELRPDGQLRSICTVQRVPMPRSSYLAHTRAPVCRAVVNGQATPVPMHPAPSSAIHYARQEDGPSVKEAFGLQVASHPVDLRNDGKPAQIGLVSYAWSTGAGCGTNTAATFPAVLEPDGRVDLTHPVNRTLMLETTGQTTFDRYGPSYPGDGHLVTYKGQVYFVAYAEPAGPKKPVTDGLAEVIRYTAKGIQAVCGYTPYHFVVAAPGKRSLRKWGRR